MSEQVPVSADTLIDARWVIPMIPAQTILTDHSLAVTDDRITWIGPSSEADRHVKARRRLRLDRHALIPGFVNAHGHSPMVLFRGFADDIPLKEWLEQRIWPLESEFVGREFVSQGSTLAIAEMIAGGTTTFADMYFFPDEVAASCINAHMRVQLASPVLDFPTAWAQDADEYIRKATQLHDDYRASDLVYTAFGPHAPYTVSDEPLRKINMLAEELDVPVHMHVHETAQEVSDALQSDGRRPLKRLQELGLLSPRLLCVHATALEVEEMQLLAQQGASVIHCPESNLKLASGFCRVAELQQHKVNIALGTDGGASNNDLDMLGETQTAAQLGKAVAGDASAVSAWSALEMATINGARALGLETLTGSLECGKLADLTAIDLDALNTLPVFNPVSQIVYAAAARQVSHVWCGGKALYQEGELLTLDATLLKQQAQEWQQRIAAF